MESIDSDAIHAIFRILEQASQGIVGTVRVLAANEHGLQEITVAAMESTQWARLQAIFDSLPPLAPPAGTQ